MTAARQAAELRQVLLAQSPVSLDPSSGAHTGAHLARPPGPHRCVPSHIVRGLAPGSRPRRDRVQPASGSMQRLSLGHHGAPRGRAIPPALAACQPGRARSPAPSHRRNVRKPSSPSSLFSWCLRRGQGTGRPQPGSHGQLQRTVSGPAALQLRHQPAPPAAAHNASPSAIMRKLPATRMARP